MCGASVSALPICERLLRSVTNTTAFCPSPEFRNPDGPEAADTIDALYEALERMELKFGGASNTRSPGQEAALKAANAALAKARGQ